MKRRGEESPFAALLPAETVLGQMEMAVIVIDRFSNILYGNEFARQLFGFGEEYIGHSILSLGIAEEDHEQARELARHVLRGGVWEGTFSNLRRDGGTVYTRAHAVPRRRRHRDLRARGAAQQPARTGPLRPAGADRRAAGRLA